MTPEHLRKNVYLMLEVDAVTDEERVAWERKHGPCNPKAASQNPPDIKTWLVNDTDEDLLVKTWAHESVTLDDEGTVSTSVNEGGHGVVRARSTVLFDKDWWWAFDWPIQWTLHVTDAAGDRHRATAWRGKYGWYDVEEHVPVPYTNRYGKRIDLSVEMTPERERPAAPAMPRG